MPDNVYEVVAQGARYWFLFWMVLIAWRSWRWYRKDRRAAKRRLKLLPDAGFVGEMVVVDGGGVLERGAVLAVPREGTLGSLRTNDLFLPAQGVDKRHAWFRFDDRKGLLVEPFGKNQLTVDGAAFENRREPLYMAHGSWLIVGGVQMRLRLFAGFESVGHAARRTGVEVPVEEPQQPQSQAISPEQYAQMQQMLYQQWQMQQAYQQGYQQAMAQQAAQEEPDEYEEYEEYEEKQPEWSYEENPEELPYDMAQIAREEGLVDNRIFMRPESVKKPELPPQEEGQAPIFYPPEMDEEEDEEDWVLEADEDMNDAVQPPRSAYVGHDDAARAKREVWDKYFGGGEGR